MDLTFSVFQQGDGKLYGQFGCLGTFHFISKGELIEEDTILRIEFPLVDEVF
jgi:hypothetical protein